LKLRLCVKSKGRHLSESPAETTMPNCFKNRLDKFWNNQEMIFDYKAELTGVGNSNNNNYI